MNPLDLGYIKPAEHGEQLAGIGQLAEDFRKKKKAEAGRQALSDAWEAQDPAALAQVAADYPELAPQIKELSNTQRFLQEDTLRNNALTAMKALNISDSAERNKFLTSELTRLQKAGDPRWEDVMEAVGMEDQDQQSQVLRDVVNMATRFGAIEPESSMLGKSGKFSARSIIYNDGSTFAMNPDTGKGEVRNQLGELVEGDERLMTLRKGRESGIAYEHDKALAAETGKGKGRLEYEPEIARRVDRAKSAVAAANKLVPEMQKVRRNIANYDQALQALDDGAETGVMDQYVKSVTAASIELDNLRNQLGLDVIGAVTFGALSKGELDLALDTALPTSMQPDDLRKWIIERRDAQKKFLAEMEKANLMMQDGYSPAEVYARMNSIPPNRTEADITGNMRKYNMTRQEVLEHMWNAHEQRKR